jgi:hypothetical protein
MPSPNGYDDFVKAGGLVAGDLSGYEDLKEIELSELVETNAESIRLVRVGLTRECRVPDDYSPGYMGRFVGQAPSFRKLAFLLCAKGRLAQIRSETGEAVRDYLDAVRFGQQSSRGGFMISKLIGIACESSGLKCLESFVNTLDAQDCRQAVKSIELIEAQEQPVETFLEQEAAWSHKALDWRTKCLAIFEYRDLQKEKQDFAQKVAKNLTRRRRLMFALATRAYTLDHGAPPKTAADLVPAYLKAVPQDPVTGADMTLGP